MKPIFKERDNWKDGRIYNLCFYYAHTTARHLHQTDKNTQDILRVKELDPNAIRRFAQEVSDFLMPGIAIAIVPSHAPEKTDTGIRRVGQLVANSCGRIDATGVLQRTQMIRPLHEGGDRRPEVLRASLRVANPELVKGQSLVLLDDVTTTGTSLHVGYHMLLEAGAARVKLLALGKTWSSS